MKFVWAAIGFAGALAVAQPTFACTITDFNSYRRWLGPEPAVTLDQAATVDWVRFETRLPYRCRRKESGDRDCLGAAVLNQPFVAVVRERLKGHSPARFTLNLKDARGATLESRLFFAANQKREAEGRHRSAQDWNEAQIDVTGFPGDDNCGSTQPAVEPRLSYIVFRNTAGAVTGLIPVEHEDDEWLQRLRRYANDPRAFGRAPYPVDQYFRMVKKAALVRIDRCKPNSLLGFAEVEATQLRGAIGELSPGSDPESESLRWSFIGEYFAWKGQACPTGATVLVTRTPWDGRYRGDLGWARASVPEMTDAEFDAERQRIESTRFWAPDLPSIAVVRNGRVRTADLMTGLALIGPAEVSVDDVFRWVEASGPNGEARIEATVPMPARVGSTPAAWERWLPLDLEENSGPKIAALVGIGLVTILGFLAIARWGGRRRGPRQPR